MKLLSPETQAAEVKELFLKDGKWSDRFYHGWKTGHPKEVAALFALGPDPSIDEMVAVLYPACIKDDECDECRQHCRELVELGHDDGCDEYRKAALCKPCLSKALGLFP